MQTLNSIVKRTPDGFWDASERNKKIKPFPGVFPTRWYITVRENQRRDSKIIYSYIGKPDQTIALRMERFLSDRVQRRIFCAEFDRLGAFRLCVQHTPALRFSLTAISHHRMYYYYPLYGSDACDFFHPWRDKPLFHKEIHLGDLKWYVYDNHAKTDNGTESRNEKLRRYREWLRKNTPWK